jgi:hypothetical protein
MAVGSTEHIVVVSATRTERKLGLVIVRLTPVHLLRRSGQWRSISRPAQATVTAPVADTIFIIGMLSIRVGVALRSALVWKASAGSIRRVPLLGVFEGIRLMTVIAVLTAKRTILGSCALISIHVDSSVDRGGRDRCRRLRCRRLGSGRNITSSCEGKVLKAAEGSGRTALACASIMLQPADVTAPVADSEDHLLDIVGHAIEVRAVALVIYYFFSSLSHLKSIATELAT